MKGRSVFRVFRWERVALVFSVLLCVSAVLALPPLPGPEQPIPDEPAPPPSGDVTAGDQTNVASPLYPFPSVGGPKQTGESHAPIALGALQPVLNETDAVIQTAYGPFALTRSYAKGFLSGPITSPFGGRDWQTNLYSAILMRDTRTPASTCLGYLLDCKKWTVLTPGGNTYDFRPCTPPVGGWCYAGEEREVQRPKTLEDRDLLLRWDGKQFELIRPGRQRLIYRKSSGTYVTPIGFRMTLYGLAEMRLARNGEGKEPTIAKFKYTTLNTSPCPDGEWSVTVQGIRPSHSRDQASV